MEKSKVTRALADLSGKEGTLHNGGTKRITWGRIIIGNNHLFDDYYWSFDIDQMTYYVSW